VLEQRIRIHGSSLTVEWNPERDGRNRARPGHEDEPYFTLRGADGERYDSVPLVAGGVATAIWYVREIDTLRGERGARVLFVTDENGDLVVTRPYSPAVRDAVNTARAAAGLRALAGPETPPLRMNAEDAPAVVALLDTLGRRLEEMAYWGPVPLVTPAGPPQPCGPPWAGPSETFAGTHQELWAASCAVAGLPAAPPQA